MSEVRLAAERRTEFGKGGARRTRRAGKIPAVIYGHGADPRHVSLPAREFTNAVRHGGANVLLTLDLEGREELVIPKAIQRHAIKGTFDHVDLLAVRQGEKITVDVPLVIAGEVAAGALLNVESTTVAVEAEATHLPSEIALDVAGREPGTHITAGDVPLPDGVSLATDPTHLLVAIVEAPTAEQLEAEIAEAAEEMGVVQQRPVEAPEDTVAEAPEAAAAPAGAE